LKNWLRIELYILCYSFERIQLTDGWIDGWDIISIWYMDGRTDGQIDGWDLKVYGKTRAVETHFKKT